eukprot:98627-Rhodomonas_salina.1
MLCSDQNVVANGSFCTDILAPHSRLGVGTMPASHVDFTARAFFDPFRPRVPPIFKPVPDTLLPLLFILHFGEPAWMRNEKLYKIIGRPGRGGSKPGKKKKQAGDYKLTIWWKLIHHPDVRDPQTRCAKLFRQRFRLPFPMFEDLMARIRAKNWWREDPTNKKFIPLELKVLGALRVLGRGVHFDDIAELTDSSAGTHCTFFHEFTAKMVTLYDEFIVTPTSKEQIDRVTSVYKMHGLPGCVGSIDCCHVPWENCPAMWRSLYQGKEGHPTISYELVADHCRSILATTPGHMGSWNDKTIC